MTDIRPWTLSQVTLPYPKTVAQQHLREMVKQLTNQEVCFEVTPSELRGLLISSAWGTAEETSFNIYVIYD